VDKKYMAITNRSSGPPSTGCYETKRPKRIQVLGIAKDTYRWTYCIASISHKKRSISEKTGRIFQRQESKDRKAVNLLK